MCVEGPIFHFHDYGRKSINPQSELVETTVGLHKTSLPRVRNVDQLSCSNGFVHQLQMTSQEFPLHQTKEQAVPPASSVSSEKSGRFYSPKSFKRRTYRTTPQCPSQTPNPSGKRSISQCLPNGVASGLTLPVLQFQRLAIFAIMALGLEHLKIVHYYGFSYLLC